MQVTSDFLKSLWVSRLPKPAQAILTVSDQDLDQLAILADKITEVTYNEIMSVSSALDSFTLSELTKQVAELTKQINSIKNDRSRSFSRRGGLGSIKNDSGR